jgi:hypothetical protein
MKKRKTLILILDKDNPEKELDFEIEFQLSLTAAQRYEMMDRLVKNGLGFVKQNGYQNSPPIITRS